MPAAWASSARSAAKPATAAPAATMKPARVRPSWASASAPSMSSAIEVEPVVAHDASPQLAELAAHLAPRRRHVDRVGRGVAVADAADPGGVARLDRDDPRGRQERARRDVRRLAVVRADGDVLELRRRACERVGVGRDVGGVVVRFRIGLVAERVLEVGQVLALVRDDRPRVLLELAGQTGTLERGLVERDLDALHEQQQVEDLHVLLGRGRGASRSAAPSAVTAASAPPAASAAERSAVPRLTVRLVSRSGARVERCWCKVNPRGETQTTGASWPP